MSFVLSALLFTLPLVTPSTENSPEIGTAERVGKKPIPTLVTWTQSDKADTGEVTVDHFEVLVTDSSGVELARVEVPAGTFSVELNKTTVPDLKVYSRYVIEIFEVRTDGTEEDSFTEDFHTGPPKLKNIRVTDKANEFDGSVSAVLRWRQPTTLKGNYLTYEYKVALKKNKKNLVLDDSEYGDMKSLALKDLPHKRLQVKVRAVGSSSTYGTGQWSAWKEFNTPPAD